MPKTINGKKVTKKQEKAWEKVYKKTGNGAIATSVVKKMRKKKQSK